MIIYTPPKVASEIPVIDLSAGFSPHQADRRRVAGDIHRACRETGFFYVSNHRLPQRSIDRQFAAARQFFDLPLEAKLALHMKNSPSTAGYEPIGGQILDSQDAAAAPAPPDMKEAFYCGMELPNDHPYAARRLRSFGHNQWPSLPGFREQAIAWQAALRDLGDRLLALLALSLDFPENWFRPFYPIPEMTLLLSNNTPPLDPPEASHRCAGAH